jgi:hypothetical protein
MASTYPFFFSCSQAEEMIRDQKRRLPRIMIIISARKKREKKRGGMDETADGKAEMMQQQPGDQQSTHTHRALPGMKGDEG